MCEQWTVQTATDGPEDGDAFTAVLPEDDSYWTADLAPGVCLLQPEVETRLIKVDKDLLLMNELGYLDSIIPPRLRTLFESLVVHVRHL